MNNRNKDLLQLAAADSRGNFPNQAYIPIAPEISIETKQALEAITTVKDLNAFYKKHKGENAGILEDFTNACAKRKAEILESQEQSQEETADADS